MRKRWWYLATGIVVALVALLSAGVVISSPPAQDVIVSGGHEGMRELYRSFENDAYQAQVVSLAPYDEATGAALVIDTVHHEVHEGEMWHAERTVSGVADAGAVNLLLHVGGAVDAHAVFEVLASGQVTVSLYESPTVNTLGTEVAIYNMDRNITTTAHSQLYHTPSITTTGSVALVNGRLLPGGTSPQTRVGGGIRQNTEWILAPSRNYLFRVTNNSGSAAIINTVVEWYEEEND